jgi:hypothetical protein
MVMLLGANWVLQGSVQPEAAATPRPPNTLPAPTQETVPDRHVQENTLMKALVNDPGNADLHGQLGLLYFHSLNYELASAELSCVIEGCTATTLATELPTTIQTVVTALPLNQKTLEYYYTYSSILTALSTPMHNTCQRAATLNEAIKEFVAHNPGDDYVLGIMEENSNICDMAGQPALVCANTLANCNTLLAEAQQHLGFQLRVPAVGLLHYTATNLGYNLGSHSLKLAFTKGTDTLYIFQRPIPKGEGYESWDVRDTYPASMPQPLKLADFVGQFVPGVVGQNPANDGDLSVRLYWQANGFEYLIYRDIPADGSRAQFVALADEMMAQSLASPANAATPIP